MLRARACVTPVLLSLALAACHPAGKPVEAGPAVLPVHEGFFVYHSRIDSGLDWERHAFVSDAADVVVNLSPTERFYFWRAASYRPRWQVGDQAAYVPLDRETSGDGEGLRWDRLNRHSHVRVLSRGPDEIVVHWRYAPVFDADEDPVLPGWVGWVDEVYTVRRDRTVERVIDDHDAGTRTTVALALLPDGRIEERARSTAPLVPAVPVVSPTDALPVGPDRDFGARTTLLGYAGPWDHQAEDAPGHAARSADWNDNWQVGAHADVVVDFDDSADQWVFWRGLSYVPAMVSASGAWVSNEFNETWELPEMCEEGGAEPMNDKQARTSHVRIIESTPARAVVHWRYHPTGTCQNLVDTEDAPEGWGMTAEFFYTIYPDGSTVQRNTVHSVSRDLDIEFHEALLIHGPGRRAADSLVLRDTVTVMDMAGAAVQLDAENGGLNAIGDAPIAVGTGAHITRIDLRDTPRDAYTIMEPGPGLEVRPYFEPDFATEHPGRHLVAWDHWPVNLVRAFGRVAEDPALPSHSSLFHMMGNPAFATTPTSETRLLLTGLGDRDPAGVARLARAWLQPPALVDAEGLTDARHDRAQRATTLTATAAALSFTLAASADQPVVNPAFVVAGWTPAQAASLAVWVDGAELAAARVGVERSPTGAPLVVVYVPIETEAPVSIALTPR